MKKYWTGFSSKALLLFLFLAGILPASAQNEVSAPQGPEMASGFYTEGKIYIVIGVIAIVLCGLFLYLIRIDKKISKLEKEVHHK